MNAPRWKYLVVSMLGLSWAVDALLSAATGEFFVPSAFLGFAAPALMFLSRRIWHRIAVWICLFEILISATGWLDWFLVDDMGGLHMGGLRFCLFGRYWFSVTSGLAMSVYFLGRAALFGFAAYLVASAAPGKRSPEQVAFPYRRWLLCIALAVPFVLLPQEIPSGLHNSKFDLGWPWPGMQVVIGGIPNGPLVRLWPNGELLLLVVFAVLVTSLGWRARQWALARADWRGTWVQAALTSAYSVLVFCFLDGVAQFIWVWRLSPMDWYGLERAYRLARAWLPGLYALGAAAIFLTLFLDARGRRSRPWLAHGTCALGFAFAFCWLSPYLSYQLAHFEEGIQISRKFQK